jgi:acyl-CoA synthetase (NDP forming)
MKIVSDDIIHKSDIGGVVLNVQSADEAEKTYTQIMDHIRQVQPMARIKGVEIEKMVRSGEEVILGIKRDPSFGPLIMFGLGGVYVEVFKDVSFRVAPFDEVIADAMVRQIKSFRILNGYRGRVPNDIKAIRECLLRLGQLALDCPQIRELDINPLIVLGENQGCYVTDARILLNDVG